VRTDRQILESDHIYIDSCGTYRYHCHLPIHMCYYLSESRLSINSEFLPSTRTSNCHSVSYFDMMYIVNCNWVDTWWQQYSSHLHTNNTQKTENGTHITITKLNIHNNKKLTNLGSAGRAPSL
jgi:hypothetical protein